MYKRPFLTAHLLTTPTSTRPSPPSRNSTHHAPPYSPDTSPSTSHALSEPHGAPHKELQPHHEPHAPAHDENPPRPRIERHERKERHERDRGEEHTERGRPSGECEEEVRVEDVEGTGLCEKNDMWPNEYTGRRKIENSTYPYNSNLRPPVPQQEPCVACDPESSGNTRSGDGTTCVLVHSEHRIRRYGEDGGVNGGEGDKLREENGNS